VSAGDRVTVCAAVFQALPIVAVLSVVLGASASTENETAALVPVFPAASAWVAVAE
jgi:hypothetical protein